MLGGRRVQCLEYAWDMCLERVVKACILWLTCVRGRSRCGAQIG